MRPRGRWIYYSTAGVLLVLMWFMLSLLFPKNAEMIPGFLLIIALDLYLWTTVRRFLVLKSRTFKLVINTLFWIPVLMLIIFLIILMARPMISLGINFRTFWLGIIIISYASKMIPIAFLVLADIIFALFWIVKLILNKKLAVVRRSRIILGTGWTLGILFFLLLLTGMLFWTHDFRIHQETIVLPELPASFDGVKIVQISDVHLGSWTSRKELIKAIQMVNDQQPDEIFVTGDLANYATTDVLPFARELSMLKARDKIFVIMGNHDYGDYVRWDSENEKLRDRGNLYRLYDSLHWITLLNQHYILRKANDSIAVIGVHNWGKALRFQRLANLDDAQKGVKDMAVQLLMSHDPTHWDYVVVPKHPNIDVTFSGHTHAMQFGFWLFGKEYSPSAFMYPQWGGLYEHPVSGSHPQYLYVNRGLGTIAYPGRVGELPEITVVTLRRK